MRNGSDINETKRTSSDDEVCATYYQTCRSKCNRKSIFDLDATEENRYGKIVAKEKLKKHNKSLRRERKERKDEGRTPKMSRLNSTISQFRISLSTRINSSFTRTVFIFGPSDRIDLKWFIEIMVLTCMLSYMLIHMHAESHALLTTIFLFEPIKEPEIITKKIRNATVTHLSARFLRYSI